jgi:hypothetical protein
VLKNIHRRHNIKGLAWQVASLQVEKFAWQPSKLKRQWLNDSKGELMSADPTFSP